MRFPYTLRGVRGSQLDHWVDRPDVEAPKGVKLTGTNMPMTYHNTQSLRACVHCAVPERPPPPPPTHTQGLPAPGRVRAECEREGHLHRVTAAIARRETPGPIPNPEAKPLSADGTATARSWESRTPPDTHSNKGHPTGVALVALSPVV